MCIIPELSPKSSPNICQIFSSTSDFSRIQTNSRQSINHLYFRSNIAEFNMLIFWDKSKSTPTRPPPLTSPWCGVCSSEMGSAFATDGCPSPIGLTLYFLREGSQKKGNFMVFDHNWGGVSLNHTLIAKLHCF